jgi:hypothetical protein
MANVNDFVNRLSGGGARANQYQVRLAGPGVNTEMLSFLCRSATMPASSIGEVAVPFRGRVVYVAGERTYEDVIWQAHLYSVWPTNIAEIPLAYDTNDIVEEYDVTFRFNYMTTGPTGTGIGTS